MCVIKLAPLALLQQLRLMYAHVLELQSEVHVEHGEHLTHTLTYYKLVFL